MRSFPHSWLITEFVPRLTRRVHEFTPGFTGVCVTRSLVLCVCFVDWCLSFCSLSFGHCVVCSSSNYRFWSLLWYLQTLHNRTNSIYMTTSVSQRLSILCIMINTIVFFIITLFSWLYVMFGILLTCDCIISSFYHRFGSIKQA